MVRDNTTYRTLRALEPSKGLTTGDGASPQTLLSALREWLQPSQDGKNTQ